ncbi:MAG: alpha/beta hydrolase [Chloroflexota bacterium]|nr:MAG: alpha/beta hydrolase [Chloroflexota bacterium]
MQNDLTLVSRFVATNGVTLHVVQSGPEDGPLVLLLHGFPEFWYGWRHQIQPLAQAGFRVWAPDQRGYNLSDKPRGLDAYRLDTLALDIVGLIDAAGRDRAIVVGHDWGAVVAWWLALHHAERLHKLVILNVPHPVVMQRALRSRPRQMLRSLYAAFFQLPSLPEYLILRDNCRGGKQALLKTSRPGTFSEADLEPYCRAWTQPGAMTSMLNWYRALVRRRPEMPAQPNVGIPTRIIWGAQDFALSREMAPESAALCDNGQLVMIEEATHWVQHEEPARVNALLLDFLGSPRDIAGQ